MPGSQTISASGKPRLYHAPSSYYSMIARLALAEAGIDHDQIFMDILFRGDQRLPAYARLNPNMTVPTLELTGRILDASRDIVHYALPDDGETDPETKSWVDLHYSYPIEELTFAGFLARHAVARTIIPARMAASRRHLLRLAAANPDLAGVFEKRAAVFAGRERIFDPKLAVQLLSTRRAQAGGLLDQLDRHLSDRRGVMVPPDYGAADVVWTVFLARMVFVGMAGEIASRPGVARFWDAMKARPSFGAADIWTGLHAGRVVMGFVRGAFKGRLGGPSRSAHTPSLIHKSDAPPSDVTEDRGFP